MQKPKKKKRYEGLIQFKDALRQSVVCLQASLAGGFATKLQSNLVNALDEASESSHFLLFSSAGEVGEVNDSDQISDHHILAFIRQKKPEEEKLEIVWHENPLAKLSLWIDPKDHLAVGEFFRIVTHLCRSQQRLQLDTCQNWGSVVDHYDFKDLDQAKLELAEWCERFQLSEERIRSLGRALEESEKFYSNIESFHLGSDGSNLSIILEGHLKSEVKSDPKQLLTNLSALPYHNIVVKTDDHDQLAFSSPIRRLTEQDNDYLASLLLIQGLDSVYQQSKEKAAG